MYISLITPTYNQADTLAQTLDSVLAQDIGSLLEYIVVDGCSTDSTAGIIDRYAPKFRQQGVRFVSIREEDRGQADAINKGWRLARGEVLGFLNSDDFLEPGALRHVSDYFQGHPQCRWAYGGWKLVNRDGGVYKLTMHRKYEKSKLLNYCNIGQPSCFFRKGLLDECGMLDPRLHLAMDYDLWLRFADKYAAGLIPAVLSSMRYYPAAKSSNQTREQLWEIFKLSARYTRPLSYRRAAQLFYYLRGRAALACRVDTCRRVSSFNG